MRLVWGWAMTRLAIIVEGPTETAFVNNVLSPHLSEREVYPYPKALDGNVSVERLAAGMVELLHSHDRVTSLVDFYGFKRRRAASPDDLQNQINDAVRRLMRPNRDLAHAFSYVQQYEFEALLFSEVGAFANLPRRLAVSAAQVAELRAIRSQFPTPEHINDRPDTAPSKRIANVIPRYDKRADGYLVAEQIGLSAIRAACPRFGVWLTRLESLGGTAY